MADEQVAVDFVRFYGRRTTDQENDIRDCKVLNGNGFLHLRSDSSLLTVSNRFETLFLGSNSTLRWASLADLRLRCSPDRESSTDSVSLFHDVELRGGLEPFAMVLNKCESSLLVVGLSPCPTLLVFDVRALLQGNTNPTVTHELHEGAIRQMQPHPTDSELVAILYEEGIISLARITATTCAERRLTSDSQLRSITWELSGDALLCGTSRGELIRYATDSESKTLTLCGPPQGAANGQLSMLRSVDERFVLLVYEQSDDDPYFAFLDVPAAVAAAHQGSGASLQECGQACIPLGREADGRPPPRAFHALTLPDWRMAIVCSSDSDEILCLGSRKPGDAQRWQRWILPDEEGPPTVPTFGDEFEEQFMMGFALDLTDPQRLVLIAGEERFPPSPVLWGYTSHGSLVAWTLIHKKAPVTDGEYSFMRVGVLDPADASGRRDRLDHECGSTAQATNDHSPVGAHPIPTMPSSTPPVGSTPSICIATPAPTSGVAPSISGATPSVPSCVPAPSIFPVSGSTPAIAATTSALLSFGGEPSMSSAPPSAAMPSISATKPAVPGLMPYILPVAPVEANPAVSAATSSLPSLALAPSISQVPPFGATPTMSASELPVLRATPSISSVTSPMPAFTAPPSMSAGASSVPSCGPTPCIAAGKLSAPLTAGVSSFASRPSVANVPTFPLSEQQISNAGRASTDAQAQGRSKASHDVKRASKSSQAGEKSKSACQHEAVIRDMDSRTAAAQYSSLGLPRDEQQAFIIAIAPMLKQMKELDQLRERFQSVLRSCFGHPRAGSSDLQDSENLVQKSETLMPSLLSRKEGTLALLELLQTTHALFLTPVVNLLKQDEPDVGELHRLHLLPPLEDALDRFRSKLDGLNHMVERLHHRLSKDPARSQGLGQVLRDHADALILLQRRILEVRKSVDQRQKLLTIAALPPLPHRGTLLRQHAEHGEEYLPPKTAHCDKLTALRQVLLARELPTPEPTLSSAQDKARTPNLGAGSATSNHEGVPCDTNSGQLPIPIELASHEEDGRTVKHAFANKKHDGNTNGMPSNARFPCNSASVQFKSLARPPLADTRKSDVLASPMDSRATHCDPPTLQFVAPANSNTGFACNPTVQGHASNGSATFFLDPAPAIKTAAAPCEVLSVVTDERENAALHEASTSASTKKIMAHIDTANKQGINPLRYAASEGHVDTVQFLLRGEANQNLQAHERRDALQAALDKKATTVPTEQRPFEEIIQILVASMPAATSFQQRESNFSEAASACSSLAAAGSTVPVAIGKSSPQSAVSNAAMPALSTQRTPPPLVASGPPAVHTALCTSTAACTSSSVPTMTGAVPTKAGWPSTPAPAELLPAPSTAVGISHSSRRPPHTKAGEMMATIGIEDKQCPMELRLQWYTGKCPSTNRQAAKAPSILFSRMRQSPSSTVINQSGASLSSTAPSLGFGQSPTSAPVLAPLATVACTASLTTQQPAESFSFGALSFSELGPSNNGITSMSDQKNNSSFGGPSTLFGSGIGHSSQSRISNAFGSAMPPAASSPVSTAANPFAAPSSANTFSTSPFGMPSASRTVFGTSPSQSPTAFGASPPAANVFASAPAPAFGTSNKPPIFGGVGAPAFAHASAAPAFAPPAAPAFGGFGAGSAATFGAPSALGAGSAFGQPSALGRGNAFGGSLFQGTTSVAFGGASCGGGFGAVPSGGGFGAVAASSGGFGALAQGGAFGAHRSVPSKTFNQFRG